MDYEKAYKDALERAKLSRLQLLDIGEEATNIEYIFPELKENEDERIKKALLEHIKGITSWEYFLGINKEQMIAWLEKQGKQNFLKIAKFKVGDTICRKGYTDHIVTDIYDKCEIPVYICKTDEGESHITFTDQDKWNLKPYWKPSEEQMNALNMAYKDRTVQTETLKSLYNDLKKL